MIIRFILFFCLIVFPSQAYAADTDGGANGVGVLTSSNARYVFGQVSSYSRFQYMLDTKTGRLWQIVKSKEGDILLQPVPYAVPGGTYRLFPDDPTEVAKPKR